MYFLSIELGFCSFIGGMIGRIMPPSHVYLLIPRTCEYVLLYGKKDFVDVTKLKICDGDTILYYPGGSKLTSRVLIRENGRLECPRRDGDSN